MIIKFLRKLIISNYNNGVIFRSNFLEDSIPWTIT